MPKNEARETVEQYFRLWSQKDYRGSRTYLADGLHFKGPFDTFHRADDLMEAVQRLGPIVREIRMRKMLCEEQSVCIVYDMITDTQIGTVPIAELFEVESGKITSILALFDPRPFASLFENRETKNAP